MHQPSRESRALVLGVSANVYRRIKPLVKYDNYHCLLALLFDYSIIGLSVYLCVGVSYWLYPLPLILIGSTQRALINLLHESTHGNLAANKFMNLICGTVLSGYLVLHLFVPYKNSHLGYHHRFLGDPEKDPDYNFHLRCGLYEMKESNASFFLKNILLTAFGARSFQYIYFVFKDRIFFRQADAIVRAPIGIGTERAIFAIEWIALLTVFAYLGIVKFLLLFWIVPLVTSAVAVGWISELAEHYPLPQSESVALFMTRNRHGWLVEQFLLGRHHDNYHLVHHLAPGVPFWNMKRAHRILLEDESYRRWDRIWGGILTRTRKDQETLISYACKYRDWRKAGDGAADQSFVEMLPSHIPSAEPTGSSLPAWYVARPQPARPSVRSNDVTQGA
jgi:fatty acid desaturase